MVFFFSFLTNFWVSNKTFLRKKNIEENRKENLKEIKLEKIKNRFKFNKLNLFIYLNSFYYKPPVLSENPNHIFLYFLFQSLVCWIGGMIFLVIIGLKSPLPSFFRKFGFSFSIK